MLLKKQEPPKKEPHPYMPKHLLEKEEEKPQKNNEWVKWVIRSLGLLLVVGAVIAGFYFFKVNTAQIVVNVVNLRSPMLGTVERSNLVSLTDDLISSVNNPKVSESWNRLIGCFDKGCEDKEYFAFLYTLVTEEEVPHRVLLSNIIVIQRYWGTDENILTFSRALTDVHKGVSGLGSSKVNEIWDKVVDCDGKCVERNDLFFSLVKEVVKVEER